MPAEENRPSVLETVRQRLARIPWHPWLFALFPVLSLYAVNRQSLPFTEALRSFVVVLAFTGIVWLVAWTLLRRDTLRGAVLTSVIVFWTFTYGRLLPLRYPIQDVLAVVLPTAYTLTETQCVLPFWALVLLAVTFIVVRFRSITPTLSAFLHLTGTVLVVLPLLTMVASRQRHAAASPAPKNEEKEETDVASAPISGDSKARPPADPDVPLPGQPPTKVEPDVYFIVLDAYGRQDVLKHFYDFDNQPFVSELQKRGFFVVPKARANYDQTVLCLATALGMRYADDIARRETPNGDDFTPLTRRINKNPAAAFLKARGYNFVAVTTGFSLTLPGGADLILSSHRPQVQRVSAFESVLINLTPFGLLPHVSQSLYDQHREFLDDGWKHLAELPRLQPNRKFVFAHILAPHPPFVYGPHGEPITPPRKEYSLADGSDFLRTSSRAEYRRGYIDQLQYVNQRTLEAIDAIQKNSTVPPIILLIGDHGPRQFLDYDSLANTDPRECFSNLSAYCLPDGSAPTVYGDSVSAVNAFRLLFDHYFGANYPRLPDKSYYSRSATPYAFTDVTAKTAL